MTTSPKTRSGADGSAGGTPRADGRCETPLERRRRRLNEVLRDFDARGVGLRMSDNLTRADRRCAGTPYDRDRAKTEARKEDAPSRSREAG